MPKISDIEETPNPNAVKFILREAVSNGTAKSFGSAAQAADDPLAKALFDVGNVVSVFYMDKMITVEKDEAGDWDDLLPVLAVPIRAAESVAAAAGAAAGAAMGGSLGAITSDDPRLMKINEILDEKVRPALMGDGGYLEILGLKEHTLSIRYQGACGSCPSSLTGTLMAIEGMLKQEVDPELEVVAVIGLWNWLDPGSSKSILHISFSISHFSFACATCWWKSHGALRQCQKTWHQTNEK